MKLKCIGLIAGSLAIAACESSSDSPTPVVNLPPGISAIGDRSVKANAPSDPISFNVSDEQVAGVTIALTADNTELVPVDGLVVSGSGAGRTLTVTPATDRVGESLVTLTATDVGGRTASVSFMLTVTPEEKSLTQFTRSAFDAPADGEPALINAVAFDPDAETDDFADLLNQ